MRQLLAGIACLLIVSGCDQGGADHQPGLKTGEQFYQHYCAACHQRSGEGLPFDGIPAVKYTSMKIEQIVDHIRGHGRVDDSRMPSLSDMSYHEARRIAVYVRLELGSR